MSIQNVAMLSRFSVSLWEARKYDKKVSEKVEQTYNAKEAGRYNKCLIARDAILKIKKIAGEARRFYYTHTTAWDDVNRMSATSQYEDIKIQIKAFENIFLERVDEFCSNYPALIEDAKERLNGMFNEADYPPVSAIRSKFGFSLSWYPIPQAGHLALDLNQLELNELRAALDAETERGKKIAARDLWDRVHEVVSHMAERLGDQDSIFRDTLVGNVRDLCEVLEKLNITGDADLEKMRKRLTDMLDGVEPDELRSDRRIRTAVAKETQQILVDIETMGKRRIKL